MVPKVCSIADCDNPRSSRGLCHSHYGKLARLGQLPPRSTVEERFWAKVDKSGHCWEWTAVRNDKGYGQIKVHGKTRLAHRYSYTLHHGAIPNSLMIDHKCHNRVCVNPAHLRVVTGKQNEENRKGANKSSKSGIRGVCWSKKYNKWVAQVEHQRKGYFVGHFDNLADAEAAVIAKRNELFTHNDRDRLVPA